MKSLRFFFLGAVISLTASSIPAQFHVLLYHAHENLGFTEEKFASHMDWLAEHEFTTVTPDDFLAWRLYDEPLPPRPILLTVDDNYIKLHTQMWPILKDRGQVIVNFAISDSVGRNNGLHYCDYDEIREMEASGAVITESHTRSHPHLTQLSETEARDQLEGSKAAFEAAMPGNPCDYIAYPYGDYNDDIKTWTEEAGYLAGFAVDGGVNYRDTDLYALKRIGADYDPVTNMPTLTGFTDLAPDPPGEGYVIDDGEVNFFIDDADWHVTLSSAGYGGDYRWHMSDGSDGIMARWGVRLPEAGWYNVHAWWRARGENTRNAVYTISHADGVRAASVDQSERGGEWVRLGRYRFTTEEAAEIFLTSPGLGQVMADAVWLEPAPAPAGSMMVIY